MKGKDLKKKRQATRERVAKWRAKQKEKLQQGNEVVERVTPVETVVTREVTQADIDNLPPSLKFQLRRETEARRVLKLPDNLKERTEAVVRRFRGY